MAVAEVLGSVASVGSVRQVPGSQHVTAIVPFADSTWLLDASGDIHEAREGKDGWSVRTVDWAAQWEHGSICAGVAVGEGRCLVGCQSGALALVRRPPGGDAGWSAEQACVVPRAHAREVCCAAVLPGRGPGGSEAGPGSVRVATGGRDAAVRVWVVRGDSVSLLRELWGHGATVRCLAAVALPASGGQGLLSSGYDGELALWRVDEESCTEAGRSALGTPPPAPVPPAAVVLEAGTAGEEAAAAPAAATATPAAARPISHVPTGHGWASSIVVAGAGGSVVLTGGSDGCVRAWRLTAAACLEALPVDSGAGADGGGNTVVSCGSMVMALCALGPEAGGGGTTTVLAGCIDPAPGLCVLGLASDGGTGLRVISGHVSASGGVGALPAD